MNQTFGSDIPILFVHSLQSGSAWCRDLLSTPSEFPPASQYCISPCGKVIMFKIINPAGGYALQFVVPSSEDSFLRLLVRTVHRQVLHAGVGQTLASITSYHSKGLRKLVATMISRCYQCQIRNAAFHKRWAEEPRPQYQDYSPELLAQMPAFHVTFIDFLSMGQKVHVFYAYCIGFNLFLSQ